MDIKRVETRRRNELIPKLNKEFTYIQNLLEIYLSKVIEPMIKNCKKPFQALFEDHLKQKFEYRKSLRSGPSLHEDFVINFNYPSTFSEYKYDPNLGKIDQIHGKLKDSDNPLVFGFGDETTAYYKELKDLNNNEFQKFMKSILYKKAASHDRLLSFIEQEVPYDVWIIGMSCGLSDRVLLRQIFERDNCKTIKVYSGATGISGRQRGIS